MKIERITAEQASTIIETRLPLGLYLLKNKHGDVTPWTAIDNSSGDAWTEDFKSDSVARCWLKGDVKS